MLPIVAGIFAGSAIITTSKVSKKLRKRPLIEHLNTNTAKKPTFTKQWVEKISQVSTRLDKRYQDMMQKHFDPLLSGNLREQQLKELSAGREINLSNKEKAINRQMLFGTVGIGLAATAVMTSLPLAPLLLGMGVYLSLPVYKAAYEITMLEKRLSTVHLMAIYFSVMWLGGYYLIGMIGGTLASLAQKFMVISENISHYQLVNAFQQQAQSVWVLVDGTEMEVPLETVKSGDIIILDVSQVIPVDGVIIEGTASVDQHMLTGESQPVDRMVGDNVLASTIVLGGRILVQVNKTGQDTSAAKIGEILNKTAEYQLSMEARSLQIADRTLIPMLTIGAASLFLVGPVGAAAVLGSNFTLNMIWLRLLTMLNCLNVASERNILVKDGNALEKLKHIDTVVFDKTGTLTIEQPHVVHIHTCGAFTDDDVLMMAAAAEHHQKHPVAQAILDAAHKRQLVLPRINEAQYEMGFGIKVMLDNQLVRVGSYRFMQMENVTISADMKKVEEQSSENGHSLIYVALENQLIGIIELKATTRPEAKETIHDLHKAGLKVYIISGDSDAPTKTLANELNIDGYFANVLPEGKAELIKELQNKGRTVCFIGDGINDAIALKQADVSVSLSGATTAATDTAQIILMDVNLKHISTLVELSNALDENVNKNFKWASGYSLLSVGGVVFLHAGFLLVEVLAALQIVQGATIARKPLLTKKKNKLLHTIIKPALSNQET